jgi:hypothetical protein
MSHVTHHKIPLRTVRPGLRLQPRPDAPAIPAELADTATSARESLAAPLLLAAIVVGDILVAVTVAVVTAV